MLQDFLHLYKHDMDPLYHQYMRTNGFTKTLDLHAQLFFNSFTFSSLIMFEPSFREALRQKGKCPLHGRLLLNIKLDSARPQIHRRGVKSLSESDADGESPCRLCDVQICSITSDASQTVRGGMEA